MIDGLWSVHFGVPSQHSFGTGVVIFNNGKVYGGDASYYYIGSYKLDTGNVYTNLKIKHHTGDKDNVLGAGIDEVELNLSGKFIKSKFTVSDGTFMATLIYLEDI